MSKQHRLTPDEEARYRELAERLEGADLGPIPAGARAADAAAEAELDEMLASVDETVVDESAPTPAAPDDAVSVATVRAAGRFSLGAGKRQGVSPPRQVRLPIDLDEQLNERARQEGRRRSEIMRDAIIEYLKAS